MDWIGFTNGYGISTALLKQIIEVKYKRKSETLTIDDIMLNCETKDFSKSSYANREIDKVIHFYSFSVLYPKKEQKGQKSPN